MPNPGSTTARGYGHEHQKLKNQWRPIVDAGDAYCNATTCLDPDGTGRWIMPGQPWDLGHTPDRTEYTGPEHMTCNRTDGAVRRNARRSPPAPTTHVTGRVVVLLCGPAGSGKTTAAHQSGLTIYDRDDQQWTSEQHFRAGIAELHDQPAARAVVIRAGATSSARATATGLIGATHVYLMPTLDQRELGRRVAHRARADQRNGLASIATWLRDHDRHDGVSTFDGWEWLNGDQRVKLPTTEDWWS